MKKLTLRKVSEMSGGSILRGNESDYVTGVSTDTRTIEAGDLFVALTGENTDGHKYLGKAVERGCRAAVVSKNMPEYEKYEGVTLILVEDTLKALQKLAKAYIAGFDDLIKIGITGSTGKTGTKEILYGALCGKYETAKNTGNLNNHIGMPLTALKVEEKHKAAIFEMGMGNFGEVALLADIARPKIGIITNIGVSHISELGSRENILKAKLEITDYFDESSVLVINADNDLLAAEDWNKKNYRVVKVGRNSESDYVIKEIVNRNEKGIILKLEISGKIYEFNIPVPGVHNGYNGALAVAAAVEAGVSPEMIAETIVRCSQTEKRLVISESSSGIRVIDDTYNASPDSMKAGIDVLLSLEGKRKIAVLGDMLGMGKDSEKYHREVGKYAADKALDMVITVGKDGRYISEEAASILGRDKVFHFDTKESMTAKADELLKSGDTVLIKASRAMGMELIAEYLLKDRR